MEKNAYNSGAGGMVHLWKQKEGYEKDGHLLVLSGGDMWTGPAISTLTSGKSMVEIMNAMGYHAAAAGNHEFDFTIDTLHVRLNEMKFPLLAANIVEKSSGQLADFVKPYRIIEVNEIKVGIIGLASRITPRTTKPANVSDYDFTSYAKALRANAPQLKSKGAELLITIGHICEDEIWPLLPLADSLGISIMTGGHCHQVYHYDTLGVTLIQSGNHLDNYVRTEILFDDFADTVVSINSSVIPNQSERQDPTIEKILNDWRATLNSALTRVIGFAVREIPENSAEMENMITDAWLYVYPQADIALTNTGGIRQSIPAGDITIETLFGVLPFQNSIYELDISGQQIADVLERDKSLVMSGMYFKDKYYIIDGHQMHPDSTYQVLTNDYLYSLPDLKFKQYDPNPYDTGIHYRQPVIDWLIARQSNRQDPINQYLDSKPRR